MATAVLAVLLRSVLARGIVIGLGVAGTAGVLAQWVVMVTGTGPAMMGDLAEQWTASELRKLRSAGWLLVNHLYLAGGNIDHVLVGPGGVVVVETKWSASPWVDRSHRQSIDDAVDQAVQNARQLRLWADFKRLGLSAPRPVVVLWGEGAAAIDVARAGATVVPGCLLFKELSLLPVDLHSGEDVRAAWGVLDSRTRARDHVEAEQAPVPAAALSLAASVALGVGVGLVAFVVAAEAMHVIHPLALWLLVAVVGGPLTWPLRRYRRLRAAIAGWQTGLALTVVLAISAAGQIILR